MVSGWTQVLLGSRSVLRLAGDDTLKFLQVWNTAEHNLRHSEPDRTRPNCHCMILKCSREIVAILHIVLAF
jgi:folate-binding Fe-S cluster repair protein YgfZ